MICEIYYSRDNNAEHFWVVRIFDFWSVVEKFAAAGIDIYRKNNCNNFNGNIIRDSVWSSGIGTGFAISLKRDRFDGVFLRRGAIVGEREAFPFKCKGLAPVGFVCGKGFVELELPSLPLIHHLHRYALHRGPTTVSSCSQNVSPSFISKKL